MGLFDFLKTKKVIEPPTQRPSVPTPPPSKANDPIFINEETLYQIWIVSRGDQEFEISGSLLSTSLLAAASMGWRSEVVFPSGGTAFAVLHLEDCVVPVDEARSLGAILMRPLRDLPPSDNPMEQQIRYFAAFVGKGPFRVRMK